MWFRRADWQNAAWFESDFCVSSALYIYTPFLAHKMSLNYR